MKFAILKMTHPLGRVSLYLVQVFQAFQGTFDRAELSASLNFE